MFNGVYTAASGMLATLQKINIITNNVANVNTTGFKREGVNFKSWSYVSGYSNLKLPLQPDTRKAKGFVNETIDSVVHMDKDYIDFSEGALRHTGNLLNFAIDGKGFFVVLTPKGLAYTRDGEFTLNKDGVLVQAGTGYPVIGENYYRSGELIRITSHNYQIREDGEVLVNGALMDTIAIRDFRNYANLREGPNNTFIPTPGTTPMMVAPIKLKEGYLETSNVNIVREMVELINAQRAFERYQRVVNALGNNLMGEVVQNLSKVG